MEGVSVVGQQNAHIAYTGTLQLRDVAVTTIFLAFSGL